MILCSSFLIGQVFFIDASQFCVQLFSFVVNITQLCFLSSLTSLELYILPSLQEFYSTLFVLQLPSSVESRDGNKKKREEKKQCMVK